MREYKSPQTFNQQSLKIHTPSTGLYIPLIRDNNRGVNHLLMLGPNYPFFIFCFVGVNLLSLFLLIKLNSNEQGHLYFLVYLVILIYLDISWLACALINPGIAIEDDRSGRQKCQDCYIVHNMIVRKKQGRFHCKRCQTCIDQHKYHCYVSGNCVGKNNFIVSYFMLLGILLWIIDLAATLPFVYYL